MPTLPSFDGPVWFSSDEIARIERMKRIVDNTLGAWEHVPPLLRPIAEDLSSITPSWLPQPKKFTIHKETTFDE
jgi:hypothetical protein